MLHWERTSEKIPSPIWCCQVAALGCWADTSIRTGPTRVACSQSGAVLMGVLSRPIVQFSLVHKGPQFTVLPSPSHTLLYYMNLPAHVQMNLQYIDLFSQHSQLCPMKKIVMQNIRTILILTEHFKKAIHLLTPFLLLCMLVLFQLLQFFSHSCFSEVHNTILLFSHFKVSCTYFSYNFSTPRLI